MNENNNRITAAIPQAVMDDVMTMLTKVNDQLQPYMVGLEPSERMGLPKINVDNRDYVNDAINQMNTPDAANILPAFLKPENAKVDIAMFTQAEQIGVKLEALVAKVDATRILAGSEAFTTALLFKKLVEAGEEAGITGAAAMAAALRLRFKTQGTKADNSTPTT